MEKQAVDRQAWISAALKVLARQGVAQVRVEPLAKVLGVTKGSFYWHFTDRAGLLEAMLEAWQQRATADIIAIADAAGPGPEARLARLWEVATASRAAPHLESAFRAWGASDARVGRRLAAVDGRREGYLRSLLERAGLPPAVARRRAHLLYLTLIGEYAWVAHGGAPSGRAERLEVMTLVLARPEPVTTPSRTARRR
jgi:AcrR family transcriptional regulator